MDGVSFRNKRIDSVECLFRCLSWNVSRWRAGFIVVGVVVTFLNWVVTGIQAKAIKWK